MDPRTYIETKVVGYELDARRQAAAQARQAKLAQQRSVQHVSHESRSRRLAQIWNNMGGYTLWKKLKGVMIGALLVAALAGAVVATSPETASGNGSSAQSQLS